MRAIVEIPIKSVEEANRCLNNYFCKNNYKAEKNGIEIVMRGGNLLTGYWYISPKISSEKVILAAFMGKPGKYEEDLSGFVGSAFKSGVKSVLDDIKQNLLSENPANQINMECVYDFHLNKSNSSVLDVRTNGSAKLAIWSIIFEPIALAALFVNIIVGIVIMLVGAVFGFVSLKSNKHTLALSGIIMSFMNIIVALAVFGANIN